MHTRTTLVYAQVEIPKPNEETTVKDEAKDEQRYLALIRIDEKRGMKTHFFQNIEQVLSSKVPAKKDCFFVRHMIRIGRSNSYNMACSSYTIH